MSNRFVTQSSGSSKSPAGEPTVRFRLSSRMRIKRSLDFAQVFRRGVVVADGMLVMHAFPAAEGSRLGLSISKKVGSAPVRNRWKRLIREAFRLQAHRLPDGLDMVVRPKKGATAEFHAICKSLASLARRAERKL